MRSLSTGAALAGVHQDRIEAVIGLDRGRRDHDWLTGKLAFHEGAACLVFQLTHGRGFNLFVSGDLDIAPGARIGHAIGKPIWRGRQVLGPGRHIPALLGNFFDRRGLHAGEAVFQGDGSRGLDPVGALRHRADLLAAVHGFGEGGDHLLGAAAAAVKDQRRLPADAFIAVLAQGADENLFGLGKPTAIHGAEVADRSAAGLGVGLFGLDARRQALSTVGRLEQVGRVDGRATTAEHAAAQGIERLGGIVHELP